MVLALTDSRALGCALLRMIEYGVRRFEFCCLTYDEAPFLLTSGLLDRADLILLELFRSYPAGRRAEGVAVGEKLAARGKRCLVISAGGYSGSLESRIYWEPRCADTLPSRIVSLLDSMPDSLVEIQILKHHFEPFLSVPLHHS